MSDLFINKHSQQRQNQETRNTGNKEDNICSNKVFKTAFEYLELILYLQLKKTIKIHLRDLHLN